MAFMFRVVSSLVVYGESVHGYRLQSASRTFGRCLPRGRRRQPADDRTWSRRPLSVPAEAHDDH